MNSIEVTVFCITYNHERYIRKCLEMLVCQKTNFKYEVLVHDDASTDSTPEIIREFAQKYPDIVKPILQTENQFSKGINIALCHLIPRAKGNYIATCEGDDYWADDKKLQIQYDAMESNPTVSLCVHKVQCVNEDGSINDRVIPETQYEVGGTGLISQAKFADLLFLKGGYPFHTSSFFRRRESVINNIMYKPKINGDQRILYHALYEGDIFYIDKPMSHRRLMAIGSYNSNLAKKGAVERQRKLLETIHAEVEFDKLSNEVHHNKIISCNIYRFYVLYQTGNKKMIKSEFKKFDKQMKYDWHTSYKRNILYILVKYVPHFIPFVKALLNCRRFRRK